jgi:hypothetical protein
MKRLVLILITVKISFSGISQEIITSSGDHYSNEDITLSWTIGEGVTEAYEKNEIILNQGFQQNIEIIPFITESNTLQGIEFTLYPNPVSEIINIDLSAANDCALSVDIFDIKGKMLFAIKKSKKQQSVQIELSEFPAGEYILKVYSKNNYINNSYVIIKYK